MVRYAWGWKTAGAHGPVSSSVPPAKRKQTLLRNAATGFPGSKVAVQAPKLAVPSSVPNAVARDAARSGQPRVSTTRTAAFRASWRTKSFAPKLERPPAESMVSLSSCYRGV